MKLPSCDTLFELSVASGTVALEADQHQYGTILHVFARVLLVIGVIVGITGMLLAQYIVTVLAIISLHVIGLRLAHEH